VGLMKEKILGIPKPCDFGSLPYMVCKQDIVSINVILINVKSPYLLRKVYSRGSAN
jgi:hypothetical protein